MPYRTTRKMAERKEARREAFLQAAISIFGRRGYHATTVPMIVRAAKSSVGSFYFYYRNKEDIFAATLVTLGKRMTSAVNEAIRSAGPEALAQMNTAVRALVQFLAENPGEARILIVESAGLGKQLEAVRRQVIDRHTQGVAQALQAAKDRLPAMDAAITASCWVGAVHEAVYRWLARPPDERPSAGHLADAIAAFNLRGIGVPSTQDDNERRRP